MNMTQQELFKAFESLPAEAQQQTLNFIAFLQQTYAPATSKSQKAEIDWTNDPFIGMWGSVSDLLEGMMGLDRKFVSIDK